MIPLDYLHECFKYDPVTGEVTWKNRPREHFLSVCSYYSFKANVGNQVGSIDRHGHRWTILTYNKIRYRLAAHRLALMLSGIDIPEGMEVDHINRCGSDNRLSNLRVAKHQHNIFNCRISKNNTSGVTGVNKARNKWVASIMLSRKKIHLGTFINKEDAVTARREAEIRLFKDFAPNRN